MPVPRVLTIMFDAGYGYGRKVLMPVRFKCDSMKTAEDVARWHRENYSNCVGTQIDRDRK